MKHKPRQRNVAAVVVVENVVNVIVVVIVAIQRGRCHFKVLLTFLSFETKKHVVTANLFKAKC